MMYVTLLDLYNRADAQGIEVDDVPMRSLTSVSFPQGWIALDTAKMQTTAEHKSILAHELGHVETGSFYNIYSPFDLRAKQERRADKAAIKMLVPFKRLLSAMCSGCREVWQLAEYFDVPDELINKALTLYESDLITWKKKRIASQYNQ